MNNATEILSKFEVELMSILTSKEETVKQMRETDDFIFEKYGDKTPEQTDLHERYQVELQTSIHLDIGSVKVADEVHRRIHELIKEKNYPVEEILWLRFNGTTKWCFTFNY